MNLGIAGFADEIARFLELGFRFAREASQYIRCERRHRVNGAQIFHRLPIHAHVVAARHPLQNGVAAGLQSEVELRADLVHCAEGLREFYRRDGRLKAAKADAAHARHILHGANRVQQRLARREVPPVAGKMDACQHQLGESGLRQTFGFGTDFIHRAGANRPAHAGDDAVGAVVVAALLNFERRAGVFLLRGDGQRLEGGRGVQLVDGVDGCVLPQRLFQQFDDFAAVLCADDEARAGFKQILRLALRQTARQNQRAVRMFAAQAARQLQGFLVARAGHGAGVDDVNIRVRVERDDFIAGGAEFLQHRLCVVLVDLAPKGVEGSSFHGFTPIHRIGRTRRLRRKVLRFRCVKCADRASRFGSRSLSSGRFRPHSCRLQGR